MLTALLRRHLAPYRGALALVVVLQAVQTVATLTLPELNARIVNRGVLTADDSYIRELGVVMLAFSVLQVLTASVAVRFAARASMGFGRDVRAHLFHRVTEFSAREVGAFGAPSLITRITNDVQQVQLVVVMVTTMAVAAPITMVVGIVMALREDVGLSWVLALSVPAMAAVMGFIASRMMPAFATMQERIDDVNRILREQITGLRVVRAFVREPLERRRFAQANTELTGVSLRAGHLMSASFPVVMLIVNLSSVVILWTGGDRIADGSLQVGSLIAYLTYLLQILMAVMMATFVVAMVPRASVAAGRIEEVLRTQATVRPPATPVRALTAPGTIELRDVGFHYPGAEHAVLSGVSFRTAPGATTAVIGSTGAGKTTLVNLVARLFDATSGAVLVGGVDVRDLDPEILWSTIGLVPQRPFLFSGTVASNLRHGRPDATETQLWEALEVAQATEFVASMPGGLEARIEQGGSNVSGGQRQRLSIARAVVRRPGIYLFDDSFSALDLLTDQRLRAALAPVTRDAAVLVVAQRVSTIVDADQILVLEDGVVVGSGTHDELVASCGTYAEIVESQLGSSAA